MVEELRKPLEDMGEIDREEVADWLVDYQQKSSCDRVIRLIEG